MGELQLHDGIVRIRMKAGTVSAHHDVSWHRWEMFQYNATGLLAILDELCAEIGVPRDEAQCTAQVYPAGSVEAETRDDKLTGAGPHCSDEATSPGSQAATDHAHPDAGL